MEYTQKDFEDAVKEMESYGMKRANVKVLGCEFPVYYNDELYTEKEIKSWFKHVKNWDQFEENSVECEPIPTLELVAKLNAIEEN